MKKIIFLLILFSLFILGCGKEITQKEAETIALTHIVSTYDAPTMQDRLAVSQTFLAEDGWHVQLIIGDDEATVILDKKGKILDVKTYEWV
jgi:hypothetical protein